MLKKTIADNLSRMKFERKLTQAKMAEVIGISLRFYQDLEAGKQNPSIETIEKILSGLRVEIRDILEDPRIQAPEDQARGYLLKSYQEVQKENELLRDLISKIPREWLARLAVRSRQDFGAIAARAFLTKDLSELKALKLPGQSMDLMKTIMDQNGLQRQP